MSEAEQLREARAIINRLRPLAMAAAFGAAHDYGPGSMAYAGAHDLYERIKDFEAKVPPRK